MAGFPAGDDGTVVAGFSHAPGLYQGEAEALLKRRVVLGVDPGPEGEFDLAGKIVTAGACRRLHAQQHGGHHAEVVQRCSPASPARSATSCAGGTGRAGSGSPPP